MLHREQTRLQHHPVCTIQGRYFCPDRYTCSGTPNPKTIRYNLQTCQPTLFFQQAVTDGTCSGADAHHLAFDVSAARDIFENLSPATDYPVESRFLMTDGGLTMFSPTT